MSLLKTNAIKDLVKESESELKIFNDAITRLQDINKRIRFQIAKREETILKLEEEKTELASTEAKNEKFCSKLKNFLED